MTEGKIRGRAVEDAAVAWVMEFERRAGREPFDRRYERSFPADLESPPRIIEIKASAGSYRGWLLPLEPVQLEHARTDPTFFLYVVENVGQGDPAKYTLRILAGDHLRALTARATERRYFEMSWPTADYDHTPIERPNRWGDADFRPVALWVIPRDLDGFLAWLIEAERPGTDDADRVRQFLATSPLEPDMPMSLRDELERRFGGIR